MKETLQINTGFYDKVLVSCYEKGIKPAVEVRLQGAHDCYPDDAWFEPGTVVLDWWTVEYNNLALGAKIASLQFMEGPYSVKIIRKEANLILSTERGLLTMCHLSDLRHELDKMGNDMLQNFQRLSVWPEFMPPKLL